MASDWSIATIAVAAANQRPEHLAQPPRQVNDFPRLPSQTDFITFTRKCVKHTQTHTHRERGSDVIVGGKQESRLEG